MAFPVEQGGDVLGTDGDQLVCGRKTDMKEARV